MHASNKGLFTTGDPRLRRLVIVVLVLLGAAIVAFASSQHFYRLRNVAAFIERPMSQLLGFQVSIRGPVFVQPSVRPWIILRDVHVHDGQSRQEALVVRDMRIRLCPWPLLFGHWSIARLEMTEAQLCVSAQRGSPCDWSGALDVIDRVTSVDHLMIERLKILCTGGACGERLERNIDRASASLPAHGDMQLTVFEKESGNQPLVTLSGSPWSVFRADRPWRLQGALRSGKTRITLAGVIERPRELAGVTLDFDGQAALGRWHQVELGALRVHGRVAENANGYRLQIDEGHWGTGTVSADVNAQRSNPGLAVKGSVAAHHVDLDAWVDAPAQGQAAGGFADVDARFTTSGASLDQWREHLRGSAHVAAGPAELPLDQVERWSKGFLKFVFALPAEGAATHVNCIRGEFDVRGDDAVTKNLRLDTKITQMRAVGSLSFRSGELDFLVKPHIKRGSVLKDAPLVAVSGKVEQPVTRLASADQSAQSQPLFARLPVEPRDPSRPCGS